MVRKGMFFTVDGIFALTIMVLVFILIARYSLHENSKKQLEFYSHDLINSLAELKIGESDNEYVQNLITNNLADKDNSILDQAAIYWATGQPQIAKALFQEITNNTISNTQYGLFFDNSIIYKSSNTNPKQLVPAKRHITGIQENKTMSGYIAKMSLTQLNDYSQSKIEYFGGFVGEGNITFNMQIPESEITNIEFEFDTEQDFEIIINNKHAGFFNNEDFYYNIQNTDLMNPGQNNIKINFKDYGYIGGGFFKVDYKVDDIYFKPEKEERLYFKGIEGLINYYSGAIAKNILNMNLNLHIKSDYMIKLTLGNTTIYKENPHGEDTIHFDNNQLSSILNYKKLSNTTIPIRIAIVNISQEQKQLSDVILISDLSGSMEFCTNENGDYATRFQYVNNFNYPDKSGEGACGSKWVKTQQCKDNALRRIDVAKEASIQFVEDILQAPENGAGLTEYSAQYSRNTNYVQQPCGKKIIEFPNGIVGGIDITNNIEELTSHIENMDSWYGTCICCGIIDGINKIQESTKNKYIVLMSDGEANVACFTNNAKQDAITAAQNACNKDISVYTVGFGSAADKNTLQEMTCNNGKYFDASNASSLSEIYSSIAESISDINYEKQSLSINTTFNKTILYSDSYIEITYNEPTYDGILLNLESEEAQIYLPESLKLVNLMTTSYSKNLWTKKLSVNDETIFNLDNYNIAYSELGDPFVLRIPEEKIKEQQENIIKISLGNQSSAQTASSKNKLHYDVIYNPLNEYTDILPFADGCLWNITYTDNTHTKIPIPNNYQGSKTCNLNNDIYDYHDAIDVAVYDFLKTISVDNKVFFNLDTLNLDISKTEIKKIPFMVGPTVAEVRTWR